MLRNRERGLTAQLLLHRVDDMVGHKWFPIVLSNMPISYEAGLTSQVASKLSAVLSWTW